MSAPIVVQKYGGSSVADVERIRAVARRVVETTRQGYRVVVVVSALGNTTSELLALAAQVSPDPARRELDMLVSVGERVSMTLLAMAVQDLGVPAVSFTGSQSGIITDERHVAARVIEVRPHRIQAALEAGQVAIVAGFQGVSRAREVTTLGRGGSDTTAVVLTAALGAVWCELCSDVDGVYSADPRVVPEAARLDALSLDGAAALSRAGSQVLAADAVAHAQRLGVALRAAATGASPGSGTLLEPGPTPEDVVAVAVDTQLTLVFAASGASLGGLPAGAARAWLPGSGGVSLLLDRRNLHGALDLPSGVRALGPVAAVSAVGRAVVRDPVVLARAVTALDGLGAPDGAPASPWWWAAGDTFTAVLPPGRAADGQRALHRALIPVKGGGSAA